MYRVDENHGQEVVKMEEEDSTKPPASKRAALSTLTNVQPRVQPFRAAKANQIKIVTDKGGLKTKTNDENAQPGRKDYRNPPFAIFRENQEIKETKQVKRTAFGSIPNDLNKCKPSPIKQDLKILNPIVSALPPALDSSGSGHSAMLVDDSSPFAPPSELRRNSFSANKLISDPTELREISFRCEDYASEILRNLKQSELSHAPRPDYLTKQPDITNNMRLILVDWLVEVAEEYKMKRETLCLAVNYVDRFLSVMSVFRSKLQLVGAAAMFIASKYEEIYPPDVNEFVYITDDTYTKNQVLKMEQLILKTLMFELVSPTSNLFAEIFCCRLRIKHRAHSLVMYFVEMAELDAESFLQYKMSHIAASSVFLSGIILDQLESMNDFEHVTGYTRAELRQCMADLYKAMCINGHLVQKAVFDKYKSEKFHAIAKITPPPSLFGLEKEKILGELKK